MRTLCPFLCLVLCSCGTVQVKKEPVPKINTKNVIDNYKKTDLNVEKLKSISTDLYNSIKRLDALQSKLENL